MKDLEWRKHDDIPEMKKLPLVSKDYLFSRVALCLYGKDDYRAARCVTDPNGRVYWLDIETLKKVKIRWWFQTPEPKQEEA